MPTYEYHCPENGRRIEVLHPYSQRITTWSELCQLAGQQPGETAPQTAVEKIITAPNLAFPKTTSALKNMGFTKLVRREKGVYENVTATGNESRYMRADDPSSVPDLSKKISD